MAPTFHRMSTDTSRRRMKSPYNACAMFVVAVTVSSGVTSAFMSPFINGQATPSTTQTIATTLRTRGRIRNPRLPHLFAFITENSSITANGVASDVIVSSLNDTVPYFMSLEEKEVDSPIVSSLAEAVVPTENASMPHSNGDVESAHLISTDERQQIIYPSIAISYDAQGMIQADAMANGAIVTYDEDYPAFIKFLYKKDDNGQTVASKLFNLALLAISFSYVFFSVFNIDKGMTRGWTPGEISLRIPLDTWASYENSLSEKPVATKTIINVVIYLLGDWLSQTLFQGKNVLDFDAARTIKNGFIGMCFGPAVHEYYEFSDWILPVEGATFGVTNRAFKILMDQTIYLAIKCSIYIVAIGVLNGETVGNSADNVKNRLKPIMFTAWKFWPLVHCVTYGLIPARHRILWVNSVDLVWNAILASKARDDSDDGEEKLEAAEVNTNGNVTAKKNSKGLDLSLIMKEVAIEFDGRVSNSTTIESTLPTEAKATTMNDSSR